MAKAIRACPLARLPFTQFTRHASTVSKNQNVGKTPPNTTFSFNNVKANALIQSFGRKHQVSVGAQNEFSRLKKAHGEQGLFFSYARHHCFNMKHNKYLDTYESALTKTILDIYAGQTEKPLWIQPFAVRTVDTRPIVVNKAERWLNRGAREALKLAGYDRDGRRIVEEGERSAIRDLYGTLRIHCPKPKEFCKMGFPWVFELMKEVIQELETVLARDQDGQPVLSNLRHRGAFGKTSQNYTNNNQNTNSKLERQSPPPRTLLGHANAAYATNATNAANASGKNYGNMSSQRYTNNNQETNSKPERQSSPLRTLQGNANASNASGKNFGNMSSRAQGPKIQKQDSGPRARRAPAAQITNWSYKA